MTIDEQIQALLVVSQRHDAALARLEAAAERHSEGIQGLLQLTSENAEAIRQTWEAIRNLERNWQAYLTTIRPKQ